MPVEMKLSRIIISEINENQVVFLTEVDGERQFPILIGIFEATSIDRRVKKMKRPRPLTHDLLVNSIEQIGGELDSVIISDLREHTYFASLRIRYNGELIEVDARLLTQLPLPSRVNRHFRFTLRNTYWTRRWPQNSRCRCGGGRFENAGPGSPVISIRMRRSLERVALTCGRCFLVFQAFLRKIRPRKNRNCSKVAWVISSVRLGAAHQKTATRWLPLFVSILRR